MARQFMLRLGDGTLLAVDQEGLRAWLIDEKAKVQRAGSRRWQPLKEVIAEESAAAAAPRPKPAPRPEPAAPIPVPGPSIVEPIAAAPPPPPPSAPPAAEEDIPIPLSPLDLGEIARSAGPVPLAEATAPPPRKRKLDDDAIVSRRPVDLSEVARSAFTAKPDDRMPTIPLKPLEQEEVPEALLDELELIDESTAAAKREPFAKVMLSALVAGVAGADRLARRLHASPTWRLAGEQAARQRARLFAAVRPWRKHGTLAAGTVVVLVVAASTSSMWMPALARLFSSRPVARDGPAGPPIPQETGPPIPKEVQAAMAQLPHLAPDTIQLVMSTADFAALQPPEVFRRAYTAANRGASALTEEETQELRSLKSAVVGALRPLERDRMRAYDRMGAGRDLLAGEDGRVLALFARGVRALPAPRRERLQALYGKAIGAALARSAPRAAR